ncbi:unnamed protein product [Trifolium pratense]|uniref:Uncharacterized protein n=1 Tax=Trifolium pratense TaxID=57577 RepID=A0ACB0M4K9_TRIPR|nr:unnamed protein product [Trifolium pratense]
MDELAFLMDWDLEAINGLAPTTNYFSHLFSEQDDELLFGSLPEFSKTKNALIDEFEELCKPCYPLSSQTIVTNSLTTVPKEPHHEVKEIKASKKVASPDLQVLAVPKCKKSKKNKNKSIVKKVTAMDGTLCDAWAWRKYGQKPIKGSPYPRSYYKCSSSKGCPARKQVEKNHLDPKVYIVTYTAEHNHPEPTRRNSLAGSTRKNNLLVTHSSSTLTRAQKTCSINSLVVTHSPNTPLVKIEDEVSMQEQSNGILEDVEDHHLLEWLNGGQLCDDDGWIPNKELEEFIGLDNMYQ